MIGSVNLISAGSGMLAGVIVDGISTPLGNYVMPVGFGEDTPPPGKLGMLGIVVISVVTAGPRL